MPETTPFRDDLLKARALSKEGHLEQAIALLDHRIESDPACSVALGREGK